MDRDGKLEVGDVAFVFVNPETGETAEVVVAALPDGEAKEVDATEEKDK